VLPILLRAPWTNNNEKQLAGLALLCYSAATARERAQQADIQLVGFHYCRLPRVSSILGHRSARELADLLLLGSNTLTAAERETIATYVSSYGR
jgi:hypothetical protein